MSRLAIAAGAFLAAVLASSGCLSDTPRTAPNFQNVGTAQEGADFRLTVQVYGVENGSVALQGAKVGVAVGNQALAKNATDASGSTVVHIKRDQVVQVVAQAAGWTTEDSGRVSIGSPDGDTAQANCEFFLFAGSCVVSASEQGTTYHLDGDAGSVTLVLFRSSVTQKFQAGLDPHAATPVGQAPDEKRWYATTKTIESDPNLHRLYMDRLVGVEGTVEWTNNLLNQGDFDAGVGCTDQAPEQVSDEPVAPDYGQGARSSTVAWDVPQNSGWSSCNDVYIGPVTTNELNSEQSVRMTLEYTFEGKSRVVPIAL